MTTANDVYKNLTELSITLPPISVPAAAYVPYVQTGNLIFLSGNIARKDGQAWVGQLGKNISLGEGKAAARVVAIGLLGTLHAAMAAKGKTLNDVTRIVKVMSLVNSTADFTDQHLVTNGASELLVAVLGPEVGAHARSAVGLFELPFGIPVEVEAEVEISA